MVLGRQSARRSMKKLNDCGNDKTSGTSCQTETQRSVTTFCVCVCVCCGGREGGRLVVANKKFGLFSFGEMQTEEQR